MTTHALRTPGLTSSNFASFVDDQAMDLVAQTPAGRALRAQPALENNVVSMPDRKPDPQLSQKPAHSMPFGPRM